MKKELKVWQVLAILAALFAGIFLLGWLLSKAPWAGELLWLDTPLNGLWLVLYGLYFFLSRRKNAESHPRRAKIRRICQDAAFVVLSARMVLLTAEILLKRW